MLFRISRLIAIFVLAAVAVGATEVTVKWSGGAPFLVEMGDKDSPDQVKRRIEKVTGTPIARQQLMVGGEPWGTGVPNAVVFQLEGDLNAFHKKSARNADETRDFSAKLTKKEKKHIKFIVTNLADTDPISLLQIKDKMLKAGKKIDHVHPLRFLEAVFTDGKMKVGIRNIKRRITWIKDEFFDGLIESLDHEFKLNNLTDPMVHQFAGIVKVAPAKILPAIHQKRWMHFIDILIQEIPPDGDPDRYDM